MDAAATVRDYYEALRRGEPLAPYFCERRDTWKAAVSTDYDGYESVAEALREQTRATTDWTVESRALAVTEYDAVARFRDRVALAWTRTDDEARHEMDTRWSGVLEDGGDEWAFAQLHVSAPREL